MKWKFMATVGWAGLLAAGIVHAQNTAARAPSWTQDQSTRSSAHADTGQSTAGVQTLSTITVTGSLLQRPEYQTTVPIQVVNIKADQAAGTFGTAGILQQTAVAAGTTEVNNQFSRSVVPGGIGVQQLDLRGLGPQRSLILLDGQRPGPAGTKGQTGSGFDLNVIPPLILQRIEIVKDGSSSLYGSDAIAGVVNLITRKRMDGTELRLFQSVPGHGGGQQTTAAVASGWNRDHANFMVAAEFQKQYALAIGDRSWLDCPRPVVWGRHGQRIDEQDRSVRQGAPQQGCFHSAYDTIIRYSPYTIFVPATHGSSGPFPGFMPREVSNYNDGNGQPAFDTITWGFPGITDTWAINQNQNSTLYASANFSFGSVNWFTQFLYNHRLTKAHRYRQFLPIVFGPGGLDEPIIPYPADRKAMIDYYYLRTRLSGLFDSVGSWSWEINATHSHDHGRYSHLGIDARLSADLSNPADTLTVPLVNYFDPCILSGRCVDRLVAAISLHTTGHTAYDQSTVDALFTGNLFDLPAGPVSAAFGIDYRHYQLDDVPDPLSQQGFDWGFSSARRTRGSDHVTELYSEVGIPIVKDIPGIASLALDLSAREFKYASVGAAGNVWKFGLNWQVTPTWRLRGSLGTSYRAPALYELYLGNQLGYATQTAIDPCILWAAATNPNLRAHCRAAGIPTGYTGGTSAAAIYTGGGKGLLKPETSRAKSLGFVWTPAFGHFNLAVDYFDYDIRGEIARLTGAEIVGGCYGLPVFPNHFCSLIERNPATAAVDPHAIAQVHASYINVNRQRTRGYDIQVNYASDFSFGRLSADVEVTHTIENVQQLFSSAAASGFESTDFVGSIGSPATVGLAHVSLTHGNWTWTWQGKYVSSTSVKSLDGVFNYYGYPGARRDITAGWQLRHSVSIGYDNGRWGATFGIRNLFDQAPDLVSNGVALTVGNTPLFASQYDWFGRTFFLRAHYDFNR